VPRNAPVVEVETNSVAEIVITQAERESVDNEFFVIGRAVEGPLKKALFSRLPKGDITITIAVK
jgi:hypothetical protein